MQTNINIGIIGIGRWGKNLVREFSKISNIIGCASNGAPDNVDWLKKNYPHIRHFTNYHDLLKNPEINAIAIATPTPTHFPLTQDSIIASKHVFVEKPLTANSQEAATLIKLAGKNGVKLFVGHILIYHPVAAMLKQIFADNPPDQIQFFLQKWGTFQGDAIWELASHDIALILDWFGEPETISLLDQGGLITKRDWATIHIGFTNRPNCSISVNRIAHSKQRFVTAAAGKNLWLWENDSLYRLVDHPQPELSLIYQATEQPLAIECQAFLDNIANKTEPLTNGEFGLKVVKTLEQL